MICRGFCDCPRCQGLKGRARVVCHPGMDLILINCKTSYINPSNVYLK